MLYNPKYVSFQWQTYMQYTWSIENTEVNRIPNVVDWTIWIATTIIWTIAFCIWIAIYLYNDV